MSISNFVWGGSGFQFRTFDGTHLNKSIEELHKSLEDFKTACLEIKVDIFFVLMVFTGLTTSWYLKKKKS